MQAVAILNGYEIKDKNSRERLDFLNNTSQYVVPQTYGATGDGVTNDTTSIQNCLNTGKDVFFPSGTYVVTGGLTVNNDYQKIVFDSDAEIKASAINGKAAIIVKSKYNELHNVKITQEQYSKNPGANVIQIGTTGDEGLECKLYNIIVIGVPVNGSYINSGLYVNSEKVHLKGGNFTALGIGVNVTSSGKHFYGDNIYISQSKNDGFVGNGEYMELHHVYSSNNERYGFNLTGVNHSNLYGIFANENYSHGINVLNTTKELNIFGGKSHFSGFTKTTKVAYDWVFNGSKRVNLYSCSSAYGNDGKIGSFLVDNASIVYLYSCSADLEPVAFKDNTLAKFINCYDVLKKYNNGLNKYRVAGKNLRGTYSTDFKIYLDEKFNGTDDFIAFECDIQFKDISTPGDSGMSKYIIFLSNSDFSNTSFIPVLENENIGLDTISMHVVNEGTDVLDYVSLKVKNKTSNIEFKLNVTLTKIGSLV